MVGSANFYCTGSRYGTEWSATEARTVAGDAGRSARCRRLVVPDAFAGSVVVQAGLVAG